MKRLYSIFLLAVAVMSVSCSLKEQPIDFIGKDDFYKSDNDILMSVTGDYSLLRVDNYYGAAFTNGLFASSDFGEGNTGVNSTQQFTKAELTSDHMMIKNIWAAIYNAIYRCNTTIVGTESGEGLTESLKNRVLGEAKFLRALHYFNLVRLFGEVPLRTTPVADFSTDAHIPLASTEDIYAQIIDDLLFAEEYCWNRGETRDGYTNDIGRATSLAATAMLSRVYLHIASSGRVANTAGFKDGDYTGINSNYSAFTNYMDYYQLCLNSCERGINHPDFALESDWAKLWNVAVNKNPAEYLFAVQASSVTGYGSKLPMLYLPKGCTIGGSRSSTGGVNRLCTEFVNLQSIDTEDCRWEAGFLTRLDYRTSQPSEVFTWKDGKGLYRLVTNGANGKGGGKNKLAIRKWNDEATGDAGTSRCDYPIIRSVDLYLMAGECAAELSGSPANGYAYFNLARTRLNPVAEVDDALVATYEGDNTMEQFRNYVIQERFMEFVGEAGDRYLTLLRMGRMIHYCDKVVAKGSVAKLRSAEDYFWPISQDEKDSNLALQ